VKALADDAAVEAAVKDLGYKWADFSIESLVTEEEGWVQSLFDLPTVTATDTLEQLSRLEVPRPRNSRKRVDPVGMYRYLLYHPVGAVWSRSLLDDDYDAHLLISMTCRASAL
jgi:hypothetical protein